MADQSTEVRAVAWTELFPWLLLLKSVRIALMARVLILGALGLILTALGWKALIWPFNESADPIVLAWKAEATPWVWERLPEFHIPTSARNANEVFHTATDELITAPLAIWLYITKPFIDMFHGNLTSTGFLFLLLCGLWELLVWGLIGGAISRIAALRFTRDEAPGLFAGLRHAFRKLPSYSVPPLVALAGASVFAIQLALLGLLMRVDVIALVAGIIWPFVLLLGLLMSILLLGALAGWPLMWATVSVEGTDAFDALSRSYAYVYHRPWRLLCYVLFAALLAIVSMFVVKLFATSAIALGDWSIEWGLGESVMHAVVAPENPEIVAITPPVPVVTPDGKPVDYVGLSAMQRGARNAIDFWKSLIAALTAGYQVGFLWASAVGVYLLMRRDIDGVQLNEVYIDPADEYGMPPLADEATTTGVAEVAPGQPAQPGDTAR